jgi:glycosyltransferase involved in cell wall biosynthesis
MAMRIGLVGEFYPKIDKSGTFTAGLAYLLPRMEEIEHLRIYAPEGARISPLMNADRITLVPVWRRNSPLSIVRALARIYRERKQVDAYLFNMIFTTFGETPLANALGVLFPVLVSVLTRKRVVVYAHSFLETQDVTRLGFRPGRAAKFVAHLLTSLVLRTTRVVVPMRFQKELLERTFHHPVVQVFIPYLDGLMVANDPAIDPAKVALSKEKVRLLLFGAWSPQKDLTGSLKILRQALHDGLPATVRIAGSVNVNFPEYQQELQHFVEGLPSGSTETMFDVPDEKIPEVMGSCDILLLPYNGSGGYSGAMNMGRLYGLSVLAYDLPELHECDAELGAHTTFMTPGDAAPLELLIAERMKDPERLRRNFFADVRGRTDQVLLAVRKLVKELEHI